MGKIITVCGGQGSGKTTVSANLGYMLSKNGMVGILSTNMNCGIISIYSVRWLMTVTACMRCCLQNTIT